MRTTGRTGGWTVLSCSGSSWNDGKLIAKATLPDGRLPKRGVNFIVNIIDRDVARSKRHETTAARKIDGHMIDRLVAEVIGWMDGWDRHSSPNVKLQDKVLVYL
ncbi:hypothetical protein ZHAS_00012743 [Anopheles sinensis]|uniref:Uncharacterized protein n=1 Tax=Anopheles sinensis TaxID=74873 RepID=A0A084W3N8_ANOSI|nr:hypothetical protein ZHAS_00012743 [Anopheles sinensis]